MNRRDCKINTPSHDEIGLMRRMQVVVANCPMMGGRMAAFGKIVGSILDARGPIDEILALVTTIFDPVIAHVDSFGATLLDGAVGKTFSSAVVGVDERWVLFPSEFFECHPKGTAFFGIVIDARDFSLGRGGTDFLDDMRSGEDASLWRFSLLFFDGWWLERILAAVAEIKIATATRASLWLDEIASIARNFQLHVALAKAYDSFRVAGSIIEKVIDNRLDRFFGRESSNGTQCTSHGGIDTASVPEEDADNLLDAIDFFGSEITGRISFRSKLDFLAVLGFLPGKWRALEACRCFVIETRQGFVDITRHADVDRTVDVVPFHVQTDDNFGFPIGLTVVVFFQGFEQVKCMFLADIADEEVVDDKGESNGARLVNEETRSVTTLTVAAFVETFAEGIVGNASSLFETVHATADSDIHVTIVDFVVEVVVFHDAFRNDVGGNAHVLLAGETSAEEEIFEVDAHGTTTIGGDDVVRHDLGGDEIGRFGGSGTIVGKTIAASCSTNAVRVFLLGAEVGYNTVVGDSFVLRNFVLVNEFESVVADGYIGRKTLSQTTKFICIGTIPLGTIGAVTKFSILGEFTCFWVDSLEAKMGLACNIVLEVHIVVDCRSSRDGKRNGWYRTGAATGAVAGCFSDGRSIVVDIFSGG